MPPATVLTVVGNRPQYIKCAVVSRLLRAHVHEVLVDTGQHYDHLLAGVFFDQLSLPRPDVSLGVGSGTHAEQTARSLMGIEAVLLDVRPDLVLVYGDTNATLAGALAAAKLQLPVAHVEAGLRSFDRTMPEEVNRTIADRLSALLFCPTATAVANLAREGVSEGVSLVGDVMNDLALRCSEAGAGDDVLAAHDLRPGGYLYATVHRPQNADSPERLAAILGGLSAAGEPVFLALHPRTRLTIEREGLAARLAPSLILAEPVGYLESLALTRNARAVVTDSGGLQKEAYVLGTPCVTLRDSTEWVETVAAGWNRLVDADPQALLTALAAPPPQGEREPFYGDGRAGERIAAAAFAFLEKRLV